MLEICFQEVFGKLFLYRLLLVPINVFHFDAVAQVIRKKIHVEWGRELARKISHMESLALVGGVRLWLVCIIFQVLVVQPSIAFDVGGFQHTITRLPNRSNHVPRQEL